MGVTCTYLPVSLRDQVILRSEPGNNWVDDPNKVPNEYLFRTGGVGSVRGYSYQSLGVRQGTATVGSRSLLVGSAEYVRWLNPAWGGAAFCDIGDAADDLRDVRLARGCGVGARWKTPAGPLAVDLAYGERDKQWRLHFFDRDRVLNGAPHPSRSPRRAPGVLRAGGALAAPVGGARLGAPTAVVGLATTTGIEDPGGLADRLAPSASRLRGPGAH